MGRAWGIACLVAWSTAACSLLTSTGDLNSYVDPGAPDATTKATEAGSPDGGADASDDAPTVVDLDTSPGPMTGDEYAAMVMADGPLAYFRLSETSGTTANDETGAYDGTWMGSPDLGVAGPFAGTSRAAKLKGAERVTANALANRATAWGGLTMEAWLASELAAGSEGCLTQFTGTDALTVISMFRDDATNMMKGHIGDVYPTGTTAILDTAWHHVAITVGGGSAKLFVDGKLEASLAGTQLPPTAGLFAIGVDYDGLADAGIVTRAFFVGRLAEVAIYDKALDPARIAAHRAARP